MNQMNYLWQQNNALIYNQLLQNSQNNLNNLTPNNFLQRKRKQDQNNVVSENNPILPFFEQKRGLNFFNNNDNEYKEKRIDFKLERVKTINDNTLDSNKRVINNSNLIEKEKECENKNNININVNNVVFNILNFNNENIINKNKINENKINNQLENINSRKNLSDSNVIIKNKFFKLTNVASEEKPCNYNNVKESSILNYNDNSNEVKVLKNNKVVYVNSYLLKSPSTSKNLKKINKVAFIGRSKRSSKFRGVSKNGNQWQVLLMHKKSKSYVGTYNSEELAAKIYDILAIKYRGIKARTNFKYTYQQIKKIGEINFDINSKNLADIVTGLEL